MLPGRDAIASATTSAATTRSRSRCASTVPGREREREVAVEAGVRGPQRPGEAVVRALRDEVARGLVEHGIGDDDHERRVGAGLLERRGRRGNAGHVGGRGRARERRSRRRRRRRRPRSPRRTRPRRVVASRAAAAPNPPATACSRPRHLPTVAPRPAPTRPVARRRRAPPRRRPRSRRRRPGAAPPTRRDRRRTRPGTIGTGPPAVANPCPRSARKRITPSAAASPNAEPPASTTASTRVDRARRVEQRDLARRGRAAADLARADGAVGSEHHRHAGARRRSSGRPARPRSGSRTIARQRSDAPRRRRRRSERSAAAPTSRAKSTISRSSSSVRSSISM